MIRIILDLEKLLRSLVSPKTVSNGHSERGVDKQCLYLVQSESNGKLITISFLVRMDIRAKTILVKKFPFHWLLRNSISVQRDSKILTK